MLCAINYPLYFKDFIFFRWTHLSTKAETNNLWLNHQSTSFLFVCGCRNETHGTTADTCGKTKPKENCLWNWISLFSYQSLISENFLIKLLKFLGELVFGESGSNPEKIPEEVVLHNILYGNFYTKAFHFPYFPFKSSLMHQSKKGQISLRTIPQTCTHPTH